MVSSCPPSWGQGRQGFRGLAPGPEDSMTRPLLLPLPHQEPHPLPQG